MFQCVMLYLLPAQCQQFCVNNMCCHSKLNELGDSVRVTKTFRSCRPALLEMNRKVCPKLLLHFTSIKVFIIKGYRLTEVDVTSENDCS